MTVTLRQKRLIAALRKLREERGWSTTETAERANWSKAKLSRAENLRFRLSGDDVYHLCTNVFELDDKTVHSLWDLARRQKERGWWHMGDSKLDNKTIELIELEADAMSKRQYCNTLLPGLCQTEDYARAIFSSASQTFIREQVDGYVAARLSRQGRLESRDLELWVVIDESALLREIGSSTVMASQLDHLIELAEWPNVHLQISPLKGAAQPPLETSFAIFTLDRIDYAQVAHAHSGALIEDADEVAEYTAEWQNLTANALDYRRSIAMLIQIAKSHREKSEVPNA